MIFNPETMSKFLVYLTAWGGAFLAALWLSLLFWTYRDIRTRTQDNVLRLLSLLAVAILFLPGVVIYLILRPPLTIDQEYQYTLEEEALLRSIEKVQNCPGCSRRVESNWLVCPDCHTRLKKLCHHCNTPIELNWNLCPICGTPAPGMRKENVSLDEALRPNPKDD